MPLKSSNAISRASISEQTEEYIRQMVIDGSLKPGERLNEVALAESIGISRGPLREAIRRLAGQGYLTMETHRGAFVKSYEPQEIIDLYELRSALEIFSVRLAVRRATQEQLADLAEALADEKDRCTEGRGQAGTSSAGPYVAELDFHQRLVELGGNMAIQTHMIDANHKLYLALRATVRSGDRKRHAVSSHQEILASVQKRDEERSVELLLDHLNDSMQNSLHVLELADEYKMTVTGVAND